MTNYPFIVTTLFSQSNLLNSMLSSVAVNGLGEMVSRCLTPLLIMNVSLSLCTVTELSVYMTLSNDRDVFRA